MVSSNGRSMRARDPDKRFEGIVHLNFSHRYVSPQSPEDTFERDQYQKRVQFAVDRLSPAQKRVLSAVLYASLTSFYAYDGYRFRAVNRAAIAAKLGRSALVPYDVKMLRRLVTLKLLSEHRRALPRKKVGDIWLGAGAEYVYSFTPEVLYCLLSMNTKEKEALAQLNRPSRASRPETNLDKLLMQYESTQKRGLVDRIRGFVGL